MLRITTLVILVLALVTSIWGQMMVKNNSDHMLLQVDEQANVTIGSTDQHGMLTTYELKVITGAASGSVLKSDADGLASWATDEVDDADADPNNEKPQAGTAISVSDRTVSVNVDGSSIKVNGSDQLYADVSMTESDPVWASNDDDHVIGNEYQDLNSSKSGENVTISITNGDNTSFSIQDDDHQVNNELQNLSEVLSRGNNAGGSNAVGFGKIGVGTTSPTAKIEVVGQAVTSLPYSYGVPNPSTTYTSLFTNGSSVSNNHSVYVNESVVQAISSDNGRIHIATHGVQLIDGDNGASGSLGYHNTYGNENLLAGVMGHVRDKPYSNLKTAAGFFIQDLNSEDDYGLRVTGTTLFQGGYHNSTSSWDGLLFLGSDKEVSLSRYTGNNKFYVTNHVGNLVLESDYDVEMNCDEIIMNGSVIHSSDRRWKTNISTMDNVIDQVMNLSSVEFTWEDKKDDKTHYGLIAQEVESVFPNLVSTDKSGYKYVNYTELIPVLLKVVQEQQKEIDALKQQ
jgi:hypothetical protein